MTETQDEYESKFEGWIDCKLPPKNIPRKVPPLPKFEDTKFSTNNKCRVCFNIAYLPDTSEKSKERKRLYCYCLAIHYNLLTKTYMRCIYHRKPSEFDEDHQHIYQIREIIFCRIFAHIMTLFLTFFYKLRAKVFKILSKYAQN